jgi:hypothetical protein
LNATFQQKDNFATIIMVTGINQVSPDFETKPPDFTLFNGEGMRFPSFLFTLIAKNFCSPSLFLAFEPNQIDQCLTGTHEKR